jgi:hypothetical protein
MSKANGKALGKEAQFESTSDNAQGGNASKGMIAGQTLHDWTADWWRWIANAPAETSPILDETGAWAGVDNDGSIFFLAGTFGGEVTRDITVSEGVPILVPVLNNLTFQNVGPADPSTDPTTPAQKGQANQWQAEWMKNVDDLVLEIDGVAVKNLQSSLVRTSWFGGEIEEGGLFDAFGFSGDLASANSVGYWSVIDGLSAGEHTLRFGGTVNAGTDAEFYTMVNVNLTVV